MHECREAHGCTGPAFRRAARWDIGFLFGPTKQITRIIAVTLGVLGLVLFGIVITIAVHATSSVQLHVDISWPRPAIQ